MICLLHPIRQNDALMIELRKTEAENGEYEAYMTKKTVREQAKIMELDKKNRAAVDKIDANRSRKEAEFERVQQSACCPIGSSLECGVPLLVQARFLPDLLLAAFTNQA
jgi:glucosamine 6-phosphate synthetase-like amidotransferase/phosphosugar isomerase protein